MKNLSFYEPQKTEEDALLAAKQHAEEHVFIEFDGMNCNDYLEEGQYECLGWDGEDRRCDCSNRRVSWDIEKNGDGTYYAVARAY
jgi:hypothetical protein